MFKVMTVTAGREWSVVNTSDVKQVVGGWYSYKHAIDCMDALNSGRATINNYIN